MATEIERKFLVLSDEWRKNISESIPIAQGYIQAERDRTVRVRLKGESAFLTVKIARSEIERLEFEYPIPVEDARQLINSACTEGSISKTRHLVAASEGLIWEIDEFTDENSPLIVAEIELERADQHFDVPSWLGKEVSDDPRYLNACLAQTPWQQWPENQPKT